VNRSDDLDNDGQAVGSVACYFRVCCYERQLFCFRLSNKDSVEGIFVDWWKMRETFDMFWTKGERCCGQMGKCLNPPVAQLTDI